MYITPFVRKWLKELGMFSEDRELMLLTHDEFSATPLAQHHYSEDEERDWFFSPCNMNVSILCAKEQLVGLLRRTQNIHI